MLIAINGTSVVDMSFDHVVSLLRSQTAQFVYLRFLRWSYLEPTSQNDIVSQYMDEKREDVPSRRPHALRSLYLGVFPHGLGDVTVGADRSSSSQQQVFN